MCADPLIRVDDEGGYLGWEDLRGPATIAQPGASAPTWDSTNGGYLFAPNLDQTLWWILQFSHYYKQGSDVIPHVHWYPTNTNTGNVLWRCEYKWTSIEAVEVAFTTLNVLDPGDGTTLKHQIANWATVSGAGKTISSAFTAKITRVGTDLTDNYTGDALLKFFDIHFQLDSSGSVQATSKV